MAATKEKKPLTEEALLRMPEADYMNEEQLAFFRERLQRMEREILHNAGETTEHLRETVIVPDPADRATIEEEHALELRTRDRERKLLKKIKQAIASIDAGDRLLDFLQELTLAIARAKLERVLFLDRGPVGWVRNDDRLTQVLGGFTRVVENFPLHLLEQISEVGALRLIHIGRLGHAQ